MEQMYFVSTEMFLRIKKGKKKKTPSTVKKEYQDGYMNHSSCQQQAFLLYLEFTNEIEVKL